MILILTRRLKYLNWGSFGVSEKAKNGFPCIHSRRKVREGRPASRHVTGGVCESVCVCVVPIISREYFALPLSFHFIINLVVSIIIKWLLVDWIFLYSNVVGWEKVCECERSKML